MRRVEVFIILSLSLCSHLAQLVSASCSSGYYLISSNACEPCPSGHYCPGPNSFPIPCPIGTVSHGYVSDRNTCAKCSQGYYMDEVGKSDCKKCPDGHFCPLGDKKVPCPAGTVSHGYISDRKSCAKCSPGYYSDEPGQNACKKCPDGHFCPTPNGSPIPCPEGTASYASISDRSLCDKCSSGYYSDQPGQAACKKCPDGHFCPNSNGLPIPCPAGTVSYSSVSDRYECAQCSSGYYNELSGETSCKACPAGHYCPLKDAPPLKCPIGTVSYSYVSDRTSCGCSSNCKSDSTNVCDNGFFYFNSYCRVCPLGHYCPENSPAPILCPKGHVNNYNGLHRTNCSRCPSGTHNTKIGGINDGGAWDCLSCPLGHKCSTVEQSPTSCPAGTVNYYKSHHRIDCRKCPLGSYSAKTGGINDGSYWDCKACPLGHYCSDPSQEPIKCPAGTVNHWEERHRSECRLCPVGTYNAKVGGIYDGSFWDCKTCPVGYYCSSPRQCPQRCPAGKTSPAGSVTIESCYPCTNCTIFERTC